MASDYYESALAVAENIDDRNGQFEAHEGLGRCHHATGRYHDALTSHGVALDLAIEPDQPADQARARDGLGHSLLTLGQHDQARYHWRTALDLLGATSTGHTFDPQVTTESIRTLLASLVGRESDPE